MCAGYPLRYSPSRMTGRERKETSINPRIRPPDQCRKQRIRTSFTMKFGKQLRFQMERTLPEWRSKFLCYKDLKRQIRCVAGEAVASSRRSRALRGFIRTLHAEVDKMNVFFLEREEDLVIGHKELQDRMIITKEKLGPFPALYAVEMAKIRTSIVNLHGEMVLLLNYSSINYIGLTKILKKYDKRSGDLLRPPYISRVLVQPFFATDLISRLLKECEATMESTFPEMDKNRAPYSSTSVPGQSFLFKNAVAALVTMRDLRRSSSTRSLFSLPPLSPSDADLLQALQLPSPIPIR